MIAWTILSITNLKGKAGIYTLTILGINTLKNTNWELAKSMYAVWIQHCTYTQRTHGQPSKLHLKLQVRVLFVQ